MADNDTPDRRKGDRRGESERRHGESRRSGEDRRAKEPPSPEASTRSGKERRARVRRAGRRRRRWDRRIGERRHHNPAFFSRDEIARIRKLLVSTRVPFTCPRCDGALHQGDPIVGDGCTLRPVRCEDCHRSTTIPDYVVVRALVIDDDQPVREGLNTILIGAGHEVVAEADGSTGLRACGADPPDVVFVDIASVQAEVEIIAQARKAFPDVKVIAMGGRQRHGAGDPLAIAGALGVQATLRRPFTPHDVLRAVDVALDLVRSD